MRREIITVHSCLLSLIHAHFEAGINLIFVGRIVCTSWLRKFN
jgi:hypothetical protein